jgi:hypothetical protein
MVPPLRKTPGDPKTSTLRLALPEGEDFCWPDTTKPNDAARIHANPRARSTRTQIYPPFAPRTLNSLMPPIRIEGVGLFS